MEKELVLGIYLKRCKLGYKDISLKMEDIMEYVPRLEQLFVDENIKGSDIFVKTPVSETYDEFKTFLISYMIGMKLGYLNDEYNKITLSVTDYFINKKLKDMEEYQDIIDKGSRLLIDDGLFFEEEKVKKIGSI